jgi:hypothetical protein
VRHALSRKARQLPRQLVGVTVFDIQAHVWKMFYLLVLPFYHRRPEKIFKLSRLV